MRNLADAPEFIILLAKKEHETTVPYVKRLNYFRRLLVMGKDWNVCIVPRRNITNTPNVSRSDPNRPYIRIERPGIVSFVIRKFIRVIFLEQFYSKFSDFSVKTAFYRLRGRKIKNDPSKRLEFKRRR